MTEISTEGIASTTASTDASGGRDNYVTNIPTGLDYYDRDLRQKLVSGPSNVLHHPGHGVNLRTELTWNAGQRGKPGINADILSATESVNAIADPWFEVLGTNASSDDVTYNAEGGIVFTTDGGDGDGVILLPHLDANQSPWTEFTWGTDKELTWQARIQSGAAITNSIIWAGLKLTNTDVVATDADQVFFRYEDGINAGEWQAISSIANTDTSTDTNIVVAVSTDYELVISIDASRICRMFINGTLVSTTTALTDVIDLIPYIAVEADGAAEAKTLTIYGQHISRSSG